MSDERSEQVMAEIREALTSPDVRIGLPYTFTHGRACQVYVKTRKVGPLIFPPDGGTLADVLRMLGELSA